MVVQPAGGDAVERRDHGNVDGRADPAEVGDRGLRAEREGLRLREERARLGVVVDPAVEEAVRGELLGDDLLLEDRAHHDRAGAGGDEAAQPVEVVGERRGADDERARQLHAEPGGREVSHLGAPRREWTVGVADLGELPVEGVAVAHGVLGEVDEVGEPVRVAQLDHPEPRLLLHVVAHRHRGGVRVDDQGRLAGGRRGAGRSGTAATRRC